MREKLMRFMQGRYGVYGPDLLNRFLLISALVLMLVSVFTGWDLLYVLALAELVYAYFRMFSKNCTKRYAENQAFTQWTAGIRGNINKQKSLMNQRKVYHIYKCPSCKQKIRIPKGKGRVAVRCPKCGTEFIKKS